MTDPDQPELAFDPEPQGDPTSTEPADQAQRDVIRTDLDHTLFVEAGAGSGKTSALVDRVESLVHDGVPMEEIAAITFTEKAAAELRDRIRRRFEDRARGADEEQAARAIEALHQLDSAAVGTLHSFAQRILGEHPVEAGLPPGVDVLDEIGSQVEFESRWRGLVDEILEDAVLGRSLLILETTGVRLDKLRTLALSLAGNWDLVEERADLDPAPPGHFATVRLLEQLDELLDHRHECTDESDKLLDRLDELATLREPLAAAGDEIDAIYAARALADRTRVGGVGKGGNWPDAAAVRDAAKAFREAVESAVAEITTAALEHVAGALGRFVLDAAEERRALGRLEFHDLLVRARRLLRDRDHGVEVRRSLRARYRRLLLDEFQDTDPIQVEIAALLAADPDDDGPWEELPVEDGRLFFVGDPKQSIYRFRRADIGVYLTTRDRFPGGPSLTVNFRTVAPVIGWVNDVFSSLITETENSQPPYVGLAAHRAEPPPVGTAVSLLGSEPLPGSPNADSLRRHEAADVAAAISEALHDGWSVHDEDVSPPAWRPAKPGDICILLPARTNLSNIERALDTHGIPHRAETSSLVYASREVRELLMALHAIADPTDELAVVAALRSALYGCGDDDLAHWRLGPGGRFSLTGDLPAEAHADGTEFHHPVADGLRHLRTLHDARLWSTPAELLDRLVRERGLLESTVATGRPREVWRQLRFVVDQARAWVDAGGTDLRGYLQWARLQGADNARVSETVLPETDDDSVRIMTIHGAKGLEFPITVMAGLTTELASAPRGPTVDFPRGGGKPIFRAKAGVQSEDFDAWKPIDDQMDSHERIRLLYVAATRARDHLVVCLHHREGGKETVSRLLADPAKRSAHGVTLDPDPTVRESPGPVPAVGAPLPDREAWAAERAAALAGATVRTVVAATTLAGRAADAADPGLGKRVRDLDLPPWQKGRYGTAVGRAVHGVLQVVDLATGAGLEDLATAQAAAEGVESRTDVIARLARSGLDSSVAAAAAAARNWRELWVAAPVGGRLVEGYVDLLYRGPDGLVVVDWKTDHVDGDDDVAAKLARYRLQGASYVAAVEAATGETVARMVFAFLAEDGAVEAELTDLRVAVAEVEARAAELAEAEWSAAAEALAELR